MRKYMLIFSGLLVIGLAGCNLPIAQLTPTAPEAVYTQAAQTIVAELTKVALAASPTPVIPTNTPVPTSTPTILPSNTLVPTSTNTPIPCNLARFISDVTYPDNTHIAPNQAFLKTWRIRNVGSCSWNSNYLLIFDHQDGMGVTSGYAQPLTKGIVNPGQVVDLSVNLTSPSTPGTYTGYWRLREPGGVLFGITPAAGTFIVKIVVVSTKTVTVSPVIDESGSIRSDGTVFPGDIMVGDTVENYAIQTFLSYDISGIPQNATIWEVKNDFKSYNTEGDPFGHLGVLNAYEQDFKVPLSAVSFIKGKLSSGNILDWGSLTILDVIEIQPTLKPAIQNRLGHSRFKLRLQFAGSDKNGNADLIRFQSPNLIIKYSIP